MQPYLSTGYPSLELAAELTGTSKRTLQRLLLASGTSYRQLVQRARFGLATHLLTDPAYRVLDIAVALGYRDPSNFGRAFRRIARIGPEEYRLSSMSREAESD